jgi:hypothetical protein
LNKALSIAHDRKPQTFESLLSIAGIGAGTLRALALVAELAYGIEPSYKDPVRYAFAHGGKDGYPFPVKQNDMEHSTLILQRALRRAKTGHREQLEALHRLGNWYNKTIKTH